MLSENAKAQLKKEFSRLIEPVKLVFHGNNSTISEETQKLLEDIVSLSDKLSLELDETFLCHSYPCISVQWTDRDTGIRFMGKPDGGEFPSFVKTIIMVSRNEYDLTERSLELIEEIDKPVDIKIFITKTCGWCPPTTLKMFSFALANPFITATAIDSYTFSDMAVKYNVATVPKVIINDKTEFIGLREENEILGHIFGAI